MNKRSSSLTGLFISPQYDPQTPTLSGKYAHSEERSDEESALATKHACGEAKQILRSAQDDNGASQSRSRSSQPLAKDESGALYVVATPIGNLDDISVRALDVLRRVALILCEDTRRARKLLAHFKISTPTSSFHEHNERRKTPAIVAQLRSGARVALVSDGGTPTISDPGYRLLSALAETDIAVVPIPGPSAVTAILSVSGLPTDRFVFEGFLPAKAGKRRRRLEELALESRTIVLFESPRRIARTLSECRETWGDRRCCLGRELTKKFEEIRHGSLSGLCAWAGSRTFKGEIVLAIAGTGHGESP